MKSTIQKTRKRFTSEFKSKVAIEALKERETLQELAQRFSIHPNQITQWKKLLLDDCASIFKTGGGIKEKQKDELINDLYRKIGQFQIEMEWLKKKSGLK